MHTKVDINSHPRLLLSVIFGKMTEQNYPTCSEGGHLSTDEDQKEDDQRADAKEDEDKQRADAEEEEDKQWADAKEEEDKQRVVAELSMSSRSRVSAS